MSKTSDVAIKAVIPGVAVEHVAAIQALSASGLQLPQILQAMAAQKNIDLYNAEVDKTHPLSAFKLPDDEFATLIAHMMDGGGVVDDNAPLTEDGKSLGTLFWQSVLDADQTQFWPLLIGIAKCWGLVRGKVQPVTGGGVIFHGVGPSGGISVPPGAPINGG